MLRALNLENRININFNKLKKSKNDMCMYNSQKNPYQKKIKGKK